MRDSLSNPILLNSNTQLECEKRVCRICLVEENISEWIQMGCSCKGELAIAHVECAIRWFSIRGNKYCDICGGYVKNLPFFIQETKCYPSPAGQEDDDDVYYDPLDSSLTRIAVFLLTASFEFLWKKLQDLADFP